MTTASLLAFTLAAALMTVTPGLDTALVLRTAAVEGSRRALMAGLGIALGCMTWGVAVAAGLGALLLVSETAYTVLRWIGAAYLAYLGITLILNARASFDLGGEGRGAATDWRWLGRGFLTNILNPKVGVFYVSFLPQFVPASADVASTSIVLTAIHAGLGTIWFVALVVAIRPITRFLRKPGVIRWLDRLTGGVLLLFGLKLAMSSHR